MSVRISVVGCVVGCAVLALLRPVHARAQSRAPCPRSSAAVAAECLRRLYFEEDYDDGHAEGAGLVARFPHSPELWAWLAANLASDLREDSAAAAATRMQRRWPRSAWTHFARALALAPSGGTWAQAQAEAHRARALAPAQRDMWWLNAYFLWLDHQPAAAAALIDTAVARVGASPELLVQQAWALRQSAGAGGTDSAGVARGEAVLQRALALDSTSANVWSGWSAYRWGARDPENARRGAQRAATLAPRSLRYQLDLLSLIRMDHRPTAQQRQDSALAWYERLRASRGESPAALKAAIWAFRDFRVDSARRALEERLLARYPESVEAEWVLTERPAMLLTLIGRRSVADTLQARAEVRRQLRAFIARPVHHSSNMLGNAYVRLFQQVQHDSTVTDAEMARLVAGMERYARGQATVSHVAGAVAAADRGIELARAERLARAAPPLIAAQLRRRSYDSDGEYADALASARAGAFDALAWVYFREGRTQDAAGLEARAFAARRDYPLALYHSARMAEASGDRTRALDLYARGYMAERQEDDRPSERALLRLYRRQHGSDQGYDAFVAGLQEQERAHRRAKILAGRLAKPQALPPFTLKLLGGGSVSSDSLRGKVVAINFWGVWCGPCVHELPQVQQFYDRYRGDPDVVVLTINNDPLPEEVRSFVAQRKLTIPVLLDDGYVNKAGINVFPTTWFVNRRGRVVFEKVGESDSVGEEAAWRVEALKAEPRPVAFR